MESKILGRIFEQMIKEAVPICLEKDDDKKVQEIKFSDGHNKKIKKMIKDVKKKEAKKTFFKYTKRVAIAIVCILLITCGLVTSVDAWREKVVKFIMTNNSNDYITINFEEGTNIASGEFNERQILN